MAEAYNLESNKLIKGTRCWVRVNLNGPDSSGAEKVGFVQSATISANFQNDRAEVIGEILPVTIDVSSVQTSVQLTGFIPTKSAAGQKTSGSGDGENHFSVKNFNPDVEKIKSDFLNGMENTKFSTQAKKENFEKMGMNIIESYYPYFIQFSPNRIEAIEFSFGGVDVDGNLIEGKIDRIEKNDDGTYSLYDYKTGTPVSEKQVAIGGTKEGYYNQLCFYKYAFEKISGKNKIYIQIILKTFFTILPPSQKRIYEIH